MRENVKRRIDDFADELRTADMRLNGSTIRDVSVEYPTAQAGADIITMTEEECVAA